VSNKQSFSLIQQKIIGKIFSPLFLTHNNLNYVDYEQLTTKCDILMKTNSISDYKSLIKVDYILSLYIYIKVIIIKVMLSHFYLSHFYRINLASSCVFSHFYRINLASSCVTAVKSHSSSHSSWLILGRAGDDQANMQPRPKDPKFAKQTKTH